MLALTTLLLSSALAHAQQSDYVTVERVSFQPSHLSPLLHYTPALVPNHTDSRTGWVTANNGTYTTMPNASVRFNFWGEASLIHGVGRNISVTVDNDLGIGRRGASERQYWTSWPDPPILYGDSYLFRTEINSAPYQTYNVTIRSLASGDQPLINVTRMDVITGLPAWNSDRQVTYSFIPAMNANGDRDASVFDDALNAWSVSIPQFSYSRSLYWASYEDRGQNSGVERTANTELTRADVLSSNTTGAPLRFTAPDNTSLVSILGTVGPDQGAFELRLLPRTPLTNFNPHPLTLKGTAERPINAIGEIKSVAWLDPRIKYDLELVLTEEGKQVDLHGVQFMRAMRGNTLQRPLDEWWSHQNALRGFGSARGSGNQGLSGGAIAGIVVGSVVGAAVLAGVVYFVLRSRRRNKSSDPFTDSKNRPIESP